VINVVGVAYARVLHLSWAVDGIWEPGDVYLRAAVNSLHLADPTRTSRVVRLCASSIQTDFHGKGIPTKSRTMLPQNSKMCVV
jgi:hypothetical protein